MEIDLNDMSQLKRKRPMLRNKELLRDKVLAQISAKNKKQIHIRQLWMRIAASVFIVLSLGTYSWFEIDTQIQRVQTLVSLNERNVSIEADLYCQYNMKALITMLNKVGLEHVSNGESIHLTRSDFDYLKSIDSVLVVDVETFLSGIQKLYPTQYQCYLYGEGLRLSVWQLKNDQRICNWFK